RPARGLQRARRPPRRARARGRRSGADGRRRGLPGRRIPLPRVERALAGRSLGECRRGLPPDAGRRHAREADRGRPGAPPRARHGGGAIVLHDGGGRHVIRIVHLRKTYGTLVAVDDLSLEVEPGTVFGFLGRNGAGKTTTIRMMTGLLEPTAGTVTLG